MQERELSVIVPCLNEAENLPSLLSRLATYSASAGILETIIVNDSSDDDTAAVAQALIGKYPELNIQVITRSRPRKGYGAVVRFGIEHAVGRYCTFVAADGVDPIQLLPEYIQHLRAGAQLVQCSRYANPDDSRTIPLGYKFYQTLFHSFERIALGRKIPDSTYAFKAFNRELVTRLGVTSNGFSVSPEIVFKIALSGGEIVTIPGSQGVRKLGVSKFKFRREGHGFLRVLVRVSLHRLGVSWFTRQ